MSLGVNFMKKLAALALLLTLVLPLTACNAKDAVLTGLYTLQGAVTADGQAGGISQADETKILTYTTQLEIVIQASQSGWQAAVKAAWAKALLDIPAADQVKYVVAIAAITAGVAAL
jgi:hypothetical protein